MSPAYAGKQGNERHVTNPAGFRRASSCLNIGHGRNDIQFGNWRSDADRLKPDPPAFLPPEQRVDFAIMGLGRLSLGQILPAFAAANTHGPSRPFQITGKKLQRLRRHTGLPPHSVYDEETPGSVMTVRRVHAASKTLLRHTRQSDERQSKKEIRQADQ
ncbi:hypothetical protein AA101099_2032 [Neoasaia chiangmaiensis NBRC 101099]|nr:hypothetical protein AA101099_2032 [Neoasaia chiangmaiensis NBRC 101099]GEN13982.1 hypothetical protein NCH01_04130 [Neoasaia chiangmaiensis]